MATRFGTKWILAVTILGCGALALPTVGSDSNDKLTTFQPKGPRKA
jgi:hypothetical protein